MNQDAMDFHSLRKLPARLSAIQAGWCLGFHEHELPILVAAGLLKPLGHPAPNSPKYYATLEIELLSQDSKWLARATDAVQRHWSEKNRRKSINPANQPNPTTHGH